MSAVVVLTEDQVEPRVGLGRTDKTDKSTNAVHSNDILRFVGAAGELQCHRT